MPFDVKKQDLHLDCCHHHIIDDIAVFDNAVMVYITIGVLPLLCRGHGASGQRRFGTPVAPPDAGWAPLTLLLRSAWPSPFVPLGHVLCMPLSPVVRLHGPAVCLCAMQLSYVFDALRMASLAIRSICVFVTSGQAAWPVCLFVCDVLMHRAWQAWP